MTIGIRYLILSLSLLLLIDKADATVAVVRYPSGTPVQVCQASDSNTNCGGSGSGGTVTQVNTTAPITGGPITTTGTIACNVASGSQPGCLSSADWTTFNGKGSGTVTSVATSNGITGGTITSTGTISGVNAASDGSTKGVAAFNATNFSCTTGVCNTIQGISSAASPAFTALTLSSPGTSSTDVPNLSSTSTLTNKRITKRVVTASDATSITPNSDSADITYQLNTQSTGTLTINADVGVPTNGQIWILKLKATNVQTYSWNSQYVSGTDVTLPTVSTAAKIDNILFIYDTVNSKWECAAVSRGY